MEHAPMPSFVNTTTDSAQVISHCHHLHIHHHQQQQIITTALRPTTSARQHLLLVSSSRLDLIKSPTIALQV